ncbi:MAG: DoxX family protein [Cyclobacteriaceae bacterium]
MNKATLVTRLLLGLMLVVFGMNGFLNFLPQPEMGPEAGGFMGALVSTKFYFPVIKAIEVLAGISFLINKKVAFAAIAVFPVMVAAFLFHLGLDISGIGGAAVALTFNVILIIGNKEKYLPMWA